MRRLFEIGFAVLAIGGASFFAALYISPLPLSTTILAAVGLVFFSSVVFLLAVNQMAFLDVFLLLLEALKRTSTVQDTRAVTASTLENLNGLQGELRMQTISRLGYLFLAMVAFWIFGGWVLRQFVI